MRLHAGEVSQCITSYAALQVAYKSEDPHILDRGLIAYALSNMLNEIILPRAKRENSAAFKNKEMQDPKLLAVLDSVRACPSEPPSVTLTQPALCDAPALLLTVQDEIEGMV